MRFLVPARAIFVLLLVLGLGLAPRTARALVTLNDGTDRIFVTGTFAMGFDSNISASAANTGDYTYSTSILLDYQRRAGLIGVTADISFGLNQYLKNPTYNTLNPVYSLELDKQTGRLTGAFTLSAQRSSQADAAVNLHTTSWSYNFGLNLHYPVIERYSLTATLSYGLLDYTETGGQPLVNLGTISATLGIFYILSEERDVFANYRFRSGSSSDGTTSTDNGISLGVNGRLIWEIHGSLSVGYDLHGDQGISDGGVNNNSTNRNYWVTGSSNWNFNRKLSFTGSVSRDFSTTATNATTETTTGTLDANYAYNARLTANAGIGGGLNQFLGPFGLIPGTNKQRTDYYFTYHFGTTYTFNSHLSIGLSYLFFENWSNLDFASFQRRSYTLTITSHW